MIFEDAHWSDPTSLEALGRAVDRLKAFRILLLVTFRPEFQAPWVGRPYVTSLTINRLAEREAEAMIDRIVGNKSLPTGARHDIIERTDGIPLFVEEMTKAVLEAQGEGEAQAYGRGGSIARAGGPCKLACFTHGAARPPRACQRGRADQRSDRARVFPRSPVCRG